ncbi:MULTISPECIES: NAD(P)H-binding protein [Sphingobacterium]|uniref:NAD(P)H-binding protein n=1 Tax=Sphingobacterium TaxID=28453 RepID=UPI001969B35E|nr:MULTISPECIES: NAD(P)H-binding protein [unclassified Sphingobacterium]
MELQKNTFRIFDLITKQISGMKALLIGATGATGSDLLELLLKDEAFDRVDVFVRRPIAIRHEKLHVHVINFDQISEWQHLIKGDVLFSCLGTTLKAAGSKEAQWKIDYDYQYAVARAARDNGVQNMVLVSAAMASPHSRFFYSRMKGQLELDIRKLGFSYLHIFNPPMLLRKNSDRKTEIFASKVIMALNRIGLFKAHTPLPTELLAQALIHASKDKKSSFRQYEGKAIWKCTQG